MTRAALVIGGGGGGIGRAVTRALARSGDRVAVADVDSKRADEAAREVDGVAVHADVRDPAEVDRLVGDAVVALGRLDVLVTVVGGQLAFVPAKLVHETTDDEWDLVFDVNLRYVARAVRAALRVFLDQRDGGAIVSIGSLTALAANPTQSAYGAAKAGLASLARSVAAEYGRDGIRMNVVSAGPIATPVAQAAQAGAGLDWIPAGRAGTAEEVADAVVFLASPRASYVNGQSLVVDGGALAAGPFPATG